MTVDVYAAPSRVVRPSARRGAEPAEQAVRERGDNVEFLTLLRSLRETVQAGYAVPFTGQRLVDADVCLALLAHLRAALPPEMVLARALKRQAHVVVEQARSQARTTREGAAYDSTMIDYHPIVRSAMDRAGRLQDATDQEADGLRSGAQAYARRCLVTVSARLGRVAAAVEQAQSTLSAVE